MLPVNVNGNPWGPDTSNVVLQDLRSAVIADLNARDERLSRGRLNAANRYAPFRERQKEDGTGSIFEIDPVLSEIKYTGEEVQHLLQSRWADFCETPKDETPYVEELVKRTRHNQIAKLKTAGSEVQASLAPIPEVEMPVMPPKSKAKTKEPALVG